MPRTKILQGVHMHTITVSFNPIPGQEGVAGMLIHYSILDDANVPDGGGTYFHTLTTSQKNSFKNILLNDVLPAIKSLEGL